MTDPIPIKGTTTSKGVAAAGAAPQENAEKRKPSVETGSFGPPASTVARSPIGDNDQDYDYQKDDHQRQQQNGATATTAAPANNNNKNDDDDDDDEMEYKPDSWVQILKLRSFYAYLCIWMINCSSYTGFFFVLPAYMRQFLKIRISENGFYCFIIQLGILFAVSWPYQLIRLLLKMNLSMTRSRICAQALCSIMTAATFFLVGTFHKYQLPLLFLNRCFLGTDVIVTGSVMSNFAKAGMSSMAFAMINTIGNLSITGTSTLIGWLLDYTGASRLGWQIIFYGLAAAQIVMFLIFALFVDSEPIKFRNKSKSKGKYKDALQESGHAAPPGVFSVDDYRRDSMASGGSLRQQRPQQANNADNFKRLTETKGANEK